MGKSRTNKFVQYFILIVIIAFLLFYLIWEIYWYKRVGYYFIRWHTHLMIYMYLWVIGYLGIKYILRNNKWLKYFSSMVLFLSFLEFLLQITGINKTSAEIKHGVYESFYKTKVINSNNHYDTSIYYHTWNIKTSTHQLKSDEFEFSRPTNSLGFSDVEWIYSKKDTNELRILSLGDSFTEGDGAPFDSSYVSLLRSKLSNEPLPFYVMNGGVCGSDPAFNFINLRDRLIRFNPSIVIQMISSSDVIHDIAVRGGMERFSNDGHLVHKNAPWWEPIYAISYISRIVLYNKILGDELILFSEKELERVVEEIFQNYLKFTQANDIILIMVFQPNVREITHRKYDYNFSHFQKFLSANEKVYQFDLLPWYIKYFETSDNNVNDYFWPKDRHHNSKGYELMAEGIYSYLKQLPLDSIYHSKMDTTRAPQN